MLIFSHSENGCMRGSFLKRMHTRVFLGTDARNQKGNADGYTQRTFGQRMHARCRPNSGCAQPTSQKTPLTHRKATLRDFLAFFTSILRSKIMSLYETCLSLNVGLYVCAVEYMIIFTLAKVQMCTCLWHDKCMKSVYMSTYVHTNLLITHKHIHLHIDIYFHTYVEY